MGSYTKYLVDNVLSEDKTVRLLADTPVMTMVSDSLQVTYRLLSRALKVHANTAKQ